MGRSTMAMAYNMEGFGVILAVDTWRGGEGPYLLFYLSMRWTFSGPLDHVLHERRKRAEGDRVEAEASRVAVREKHHSYNDALKKGRAEIFAEQETLRRRTLDERQATINAARATAQTALQEAKKGIAADVKAARVELERSSGALASEIAEAILAGA